MFTDDHVHFHQYGKLVFELEPEQDTNTGIACELDRKRIWPNVHWVSDHGNAHLIRHWE